MRKLFGALLALGLMMSGMFGVAAQDANTALGDGYGSPATWFDDRGNAIASVEVTEVIEDWDEYDPNRAPARGYFYYAVAITVTNLDSGDIDVSARDFSLLDTMGLNNARSSATADATSGTEVFIDTAPVAAGESVDLVMVYELFNDTAPAMLVWQADRGKLVLVNLVDGTHEMSAVVQGLGVPATWSDDRGNQMATIEVTEVTDDWQDYEPNRQPDRGSRYVAVHFSITNISDTDLEVNPYNLSLIDTEGTNNSTANVRVAEDAEFEVFSDRQDVASGESVEGMLVFHLFSGIVPVGLVWQPEFGMLNVVLLNDGTDTSVATPVGGTGYENDADDDLENDADELDVLATPDA
jgi:hypothetical protein